MARMTIPIIPKPIVAFARVPKILPRNAAFPICQHCPRRFLPSFSEHRSGHCPQTGKKHGRDNRPDNGNGNANDKADEAAKNRPASAEHNPTTTLAGPSSAQAARQGTPLSRPK